MDKMAGDRQVTANNVMKIYVNEKMRRLPTARKINNTGVARWGVGHGISGSGSKIF